jgi:hypothetical protein
MSIYSVLRMDDESVNNQVHTNKVREDKSSKFDYDFLFS